MSITISFNKTNLDGIISPVFYMTNGDDVCHLNILGKEDTMNKLIASFKKGLSFSAKPYRHRRSTVYSIKTHDYYIEKNIEDGYVNFILQRKPSADTFYAFDKSSNLIELCKSVERKMMSYDDLKIGNIKVKLFNHIYKNTGVPIIEEWMDYIIVSLVSRYKYTNVYKYGNTNFGTFPSLYCFTFKEEDIIEIISKGLKDGDLSINGRKDYKTSDLIKEISSLDVYMNSFSETLANKIKDKFKPVFVPGKEDYDEKLKKLFDFTEYHAGIQLYEPQKAVIQASVRNLKKKNSVFVISETGSGKTAMGIDIVLGHAKKENPVISVMCPGHLVPAWKNEIMRFSLFSDVLIVRSLKDFMKHEHKITDKNRKQPLWIIFSKDAVKYEYDKQPAALFVRKKDDLANGHFVCPHCGTSFSGGRKTRYDNNFVRMTEDNTVCYRCGESLWSNVTKGKGSWIKVKDIGWMNTKFIDLYHKRLKDLCELNIREGLSYPYRTKLPKLLAYLEAEDKEKFIETRAVNTYPISKYIHDKYKKKIDYAIFDEVHQLMSKDSQQGKAFSLIASSAKKNIALTGTLINGYIHGLFYALYRCFSSKMIENNYLYNDAKAFEQAYGVYETIRTYTPEKYKENGAPESSKTKILPGINPLVFTEYLMENAVFLSLASLSDNMPNLEEIPVGIDLEPRLRANYDTIKSMVSSVVSRNLRDASFRYGSAEKALQLLSYYPDCFRKNKDFSDGNRVISLERLNVTDKNFLSNKERKLISLVKEKTSRGEKVLVYTHWSNATDINDRLKQILQKEGLRVSVLTQKVNTFDREEWIKNEVENGLDVMICNPRLIETGLNLLDFTTIIFYQLWRNLFTMRQGSRRSWRLSQSKDISIYYMYYRETIQEQIVSIMATKLKAALLAEGKFNEEGLVAMSDGMDVLNKLAESVVNDINYSIDENIFGNQEYRVRSITQTIKQLPVPNCPIHYFNSLKKMKKDKYDFINEDLLEYCI